MIVEVLYDPSTAQGGDNDVEYVMLYNSSCAPIDLQGWSLCDNADCRVFKSLVIEPGHVAPIVRTSNITGFGCGASPLIYTSATAFVGGNWFGGFGNSGDELTLQNAAATLIDELSYGSNSSVFSPALTSSGDGKALSRLGYPWSGVLPPNADAMAWENPSIAPRLCQISSTGQPLP